MPLWALVGIGCATAGVGAIGGLGGAVILVPLLVLLGVPPLIAAPLGMLSVAAGSLAAGGQQLASGLVHQRLGVVTETASTAGAIAGALLSTAVPSSLLVRILGVIALLAAVVGLTSRGRRNPPEPAFAAERAGEWPGTLSGAYRAADGMVPYRARRLGIGLVAMAVAGLVAGLVGAGGGFLKTPAMRELMHVPVKVAAATSTFTIGVTATAALVVFAAQGRIDIEAGAAVVAGGLAGGRAGAWVQQRLQATPVRLLISGLLVVIGAILLTGG